MRYVFDLGAPEPVHYGERDDISVVFALGVDFDADENILMSVALIPDPDDGSKFELIFGIRKQNYNTGAVSDYFFDHATARQYVAKENAPAVMLLVLNSVRTLVEAAAPMDVVMETWENALRPEALGKYMENLQSLRPTWFRDDTLSP